MFYRNFLLLNAFQNHFLFVKRFPSKKKKTKKRPRVDWSVSSAVKFTGVGCKESNDPHGN